MTHNGNLEHDRSYLSEFSGMERLCDWKHDSRIYLSSFVVDYLDCYLEIPVGVDCDCLVAYQFCVCEKQSLFHPNPSVHAYPECFFVFEKHI